MGRSLSKETVLSTWVEQYVGLAIRTPKLATFEDVDRERSERK